MPLATINPMTGKIGCNPGASAECGFDLINGTDSKLRFGIQAIGELKDKGWVKVQGPLEVELPPKAQEKLKVSVTVPANAEAKTYSFKLRVYDVQDPERATESSAVAVVVAATAAAAAAKAAPPAEPAGKKPPWALIIGAIAGVLVLVGVLVTVLLMRGGHKVPDVTQASADAAQQQLVKAGYKVERATQPVEDPQGVGKVIKTEPPADTKLDKGNVVKMIVGVAAEKAPPAPPPPAPPPPAPPKKCGDDLPYGVNQCIQGYVWREASAQDFVCVPVQTRTETRQENALAAERRSPTGGAYGPDTCKQGFVWREAFPNDHVCVPGASRSRAAQDNSLARSRRVCQ
jgi:hypothetical protein